MSFLFLFCVRLLKARRQVRPPFPVPRRPPNLLSSTVQYLISKGDIHQRRKNVFHDHVLLFLLI